MDGTTRISGMGFIKRLLGTHAVEVQHPQTTFGGCMLVVDDSPTICAVLGKMLGQDGYRVLKATDGPSALDLARNELPTLIFLDVVMPGMNGFSVLRKLRHDALTCHIPIIMISGNQQATEQFYLQRYGADDFMKKPFDRDDVYERIAHLVASGRLAAREPAMARSKLPQMLCGDGLAAIPDIAMPDADASSANAMPAVVSLTSRQAARGPA
ncbi:MAG: response regulator [Rhodanobacter sp.]